ncbi:MAG: Patatin [Moraxellaceae bacterium]|jgi:NTE family protein|nr:Patatin [Moraxellaceae bacterium]
MVKGRAGVMRREWWLAGLLAVATAVRAECAGAAAGATPEMPEKKRPRVALVLSGGGARGLAHVGVFKGLEKLRIPYDCIVGTSMGAIAGGTIASGTSVGEAERRVVEADWDTIFSDRARRSSVPYFRKAEDYQPFFDFALTLDGYRPLAPRHFVGVQHTGLFFRELTGARYAGDFDDLPIPYRAVATDIISGEAVVLGRGTVAEAMRASMTVPGLYAPVSHDGHLLVDGGLAKNIPVSTARELCGDVVIVVNTASPNLREDQLVNLFSIAEQVVNISMMANMNEELGKLRDDDVLIVPELDGYASSDFDRVREIIAVGEQAVAQQAENLRALQVSEAEYAAWRARVAARRPPPPVIEDVEMAPTRWVNPRVMGSLLQVRTGEPFDMEELHRNIGLVYARGDFSHISYELADTAPGRAELQISPVEKPGRDFLRFGLNLYSDFQGDARFAAMASLRRAWLNRLDGQWRTDLQLGRDNMIYSEWYQPASLDSELFVAPQVFYFDQHRDLRFSSATRFEYEYTETGGALEIGSVFGRWGEFRGGITASYASVDSVTGAVVPDRAWHRGGYTLRSVYDQLDNARFPRRGGAARLAYFKSSADLGADLSYDRLDFRGMRALTRGRTTALLSVSAGTSLDSTLPFFDAFGLGGLFNLSAYPPNYYLGGEKLLGGLTVFRRVSELPAAVGNGVYGGIAVEAGRVGLPLPGHAAPDQAYSGSLFLAADTVLGPFYLLGAIGDRQQRAVYLALGVTF